MTGGGGPASPFSWIDWSSLIIIIIIILYYYYFLLKTPRWVDAYTHDCVLNNTFEWKNVYTRFTTDELYWKIIIIIIIVTTTTYSRLVLSRRPGTTRTTVRGGTQKPKRDAGYTRWARFSRLPVAGRRGTTRWRQKTDPKVHAAARAVGRRTLYQRR